MRDDVQQLLYLQDFDQQISALTRDLEKIPQMQAAAKDRLANDTAALDAAKKAYQENEIAIKNVELDIGTRRDTITKLKTQQFETKKNDEYTKFGEEITRYEGMVDELETQELELMEVADGLRERIKSAEEALSKTQSNVDEEINELQSRFDEKSQRRNELQGQRKSAAAEVEEDLLTDYDRLFVKRDGKAVCIVTPDKQCTSCHLKVTPATYITAKSGDSIAECDNCGCILYYDSGRIDETY